MLQRFVPVMFLLAIMPLTIAAEEDSTDPAPQTISKLALEHMQRFDMHLARGEDSVPLLEKPILTFGDSARGNHNGTVWAFGSSGRPLAILELYQPDGVDKEWVHAVSLTSTPLVVMKTPLATDWAPLKSQIQWQKLPNSPTPRANAAQRTRQMKDLARRFTAHEFWDPDNSRFELRLLVQPVHRYDDAASSIQDGAVFAIAHGTNPEVLLLIEAIGKSPEEAQWHYGLARLGSAEMHVSLDDAEVWTVGRTPGVVGRPEDPYWLFLTSPSPPEPE